MEEIKNIVDDLGIVSLETNIKIAAVAVVSDSGTLVYQTENVKYAVVETTTEGIVGTNDSGMGHVIFAPFQGGVLVSYAMPQADPPKALSFLKSFAMRLNGKV